MTERNTGGPAFPVLIQNEITGYIPPETSGMSLRDYFAAHVLTTACEDNGPKEAAELAYLYADAMLEARK